MIHFVLALNEVQNKESTLKSHPSARTINPSKNTFTIAQPRMSDIFRKNLRHFSENLPRFSENVRLFCPYIALVF